MDKPLKRFTLFLPVNKNTSSQIRDVLDFIKDNLGGCTFSRFHLKPIRLESESIQGYFIGRFGTYSDEDVTCIVFDVDIYQYPSIYEDVRKIIKTIEKTGEEAVWLTHHDIFLNK